MTPKKSLTQCLKENGISSREFNFFLHEFIKTRKPKKGSTLSGLLTDQLKKDAELIIYHLEH